VSQKRIKPKTPLYLQRIVKLHEDRPILRQAGVHHVQVLHDDWCAMLRGVGECNCNPEVRYVATEGRN
jgi:hypothetical protein